MKNRGHSPAKGGQGSIKVPMNNQKVPTASPSVQPTDAQVKNRGNDQPKARP